MHNTANEGEDAVAGSVRQVGMLTEVEHQQAALKDGHDKETIYAVTAARSMHTGSTGAPQSRRLEDAETETETETETSACGANSGSRRLLMHAEMPMHAEMLAAGGCGGIRQHTPAHASIRQHTSNTERIASGCGGISSSSNSSSSMLAPVVLLSGNFKVGPDKVGALAGKHYNFTSCLYIKLYCIV